MAAEAQRTRHPRGPAGALKPMPVPAKGSIANAGAHAELALARRHVQAAQVAARPRRLSLGYSSHFFLIVDAAGLELFAPSTPVCVLRSCAVKWTENPKKEGKEVDE